MLNDKSVFLTPVTYESTKKILESMEKCVCKISYKKKIIGTGFFCKIPIPGNKNPLPVLITNNHVINDNLLNQGNEQITITTRKEQNKPKNIILNKQKRRAFSFPQNGITMIEIKESDNIKYFLDIDENFLDGNMDKSNINKQVYIIQNKDNKDNNVYVSYGFVKNENLYSNYFFHTCSTFTGSSGSPILNLNNHKVIGIHKEQGVGFYLNKVNMASIPNKSYNINNAYAYNLIHNRNSSNDFIIKKIFTNGRDISDNKALKNANSNNNLSLKYIVEIITSIKEINYLLNPTPEIIEDSKINIFKRFDHIYMLTSFFQKAIFEKYQLENENKDISALSEINIILNFFDKNISDNNLYNFLLFILNTLHEELISYPDNIPRKGKLISFNSQFTNDKEKSIEQFNQYYKSNLYLKSIISDLFNWIRREERFCSFCDSKCQNQKFAYSYQAFPLILFDLDEIYDYVTKQKLYDEKPKSLNLQDTLNIYPLIEYKLDKEKEKCIFCGNGCLSATYYIETSPKYFIIVLNRNKKIGFTYGEYFELQEGKGVQYEYQKYELISVTMQEGDKWSCIIKNSEYEDTKKRLIIEWIKFQDEKLNEITYIKGNISKEVIDSFNARILIYKGIKTNYFK